MTHKRPSKKRKELVEGATKAAYDRMHYVMFNVHPKASRVTEDHELVCTKPRGG